MWEVHYSQEAATYLEDNGELITDLFFAMEALADSDGLPIEGDSQEFQGRVYWFVLNHLVVYRRITVDRIVRISYIKPQ